MALVLRRVDLTLPIRAQDLSWPPIPSVTLVWLGLYTSPFRRQFIISIQHLDVQRYSQRRRDHLALIPYRGASHARLPPRVSSPAPVPIKFDPGARRIDVRPANDPSPSHIVPFPLTLTLCHYRRLTLKAPTPRFAISPDLSHPFLPFHSTVASALALASHGGRFQS